MVAEMVAVAVRSLVVARAMFTTVLEGEEAAETAEPKEKVPKKVCVRSKFDDEMELLDANIARLESMVQELRKSRAELLGSPWTETVANAEELEDVEVEVSPYWFSD